MAIKKPNELGTVLTYSEILMLECVKMGKIEAVPVSNTFYSEINSLFSSSWDKFEETKVPTVNSFFFNNTLCA